MKKLFLIVIIFLSLPVFSQIGYVKIESRTAKIYNQNTSYSGYYINLCSTCQLDGYNSTYIVITQNKTARIFNEKGNYTGYYINLCSDCYIERVLENNILIKQKNTVRYYNFKGSFTGKYN